MNREFTIRQKLSILNKLYPNDNFYSNLLSIMELTGGLSKKQVNVIVLHFVTRVPEIIFELIPNL